MDEAQNLTPHEVKTIITRAGEGTKIVFTGDPYQIDTPYLDSRPTASPISSTMYYVSVWGTDFTGTIQSIATGLNEIPETGLVSIYPNPVMNGMVNVGLNLEEMQDVTITLMDMQGKMIFSNSILVNAGFTVNPIEMKNIEQGVYFIRVKANKLNTIEKLLVKQKN